MCSDTLLSGLGLYQHSPNVKTFKLPQGTLVFAGAGTTVEQYTPSSYRWSHV